MEKAEQLKILDRINKFADITLGDIDPQKTPIRIQLEALKPEMERIAAENNMSVEDVFIMYMDLASEMTAKAEQDFQNEMQNLNF